MPVPLSDNMENGLLKQLQLLKSKDKFPTQEWDERGLIPSDDDSRQKMNKEVNDFIEFLENQLISGQTSLIHLKEEIQTYLDEWDNLDFDTEEVEWMLDSMGEVMRIVNIDCDDILI